MDIFKQEPVIQVPLLDNTQPQSSGITLDSILNNLATRGQGISGSLMALSRDPTTNKIGQNLLLQQANKDRIALANKQRAEDLLRQQEATDYNRAIQREQIDYSKLSDAQKLDLQREQLAMKQADAQYNRDFAREQFDYTKSQAEREMEAAGLAAQSKAMQNAEKQIYDNVESGIMSPEAGQQALAELGVQMQLQKPSANMTGGFGSVLQNANLPQEQKDQLMSDWLATQAKGVGTIYDQSYAKQRAGLEAQKGLAAEVAGEKETAKLTAQAEKKQAENVKASKRSASNIDTLISEVRANEDIVGKYSPIGQLAGELTGGFLGFSDKELQKRGEINRRVADISSQIVARAVANGQSGINTQAEVDRITRGIDSNSNANVLIGALEALKEYDTAISGGTTQAQDLTSMSDEDLLKGL